MNRRAFLLSSTTVIVAAAAPGPKLEYPDWVLRGTPSWIVTAPRGGRIRVTTSKGTIDLDPGCSMYFPNDAPGGWLIDRAL